MAESIAQKVKMLRDATGAGPKDCKTALEANDGDMEKAMDWLRERGIAKAEKKLGSDRTMNEGVIHTYQHFNKRLAVIVEVNCETDFVANTPDFQEFAKNLALHIANTAPRYVKRDHVPEAVIQSEQEMQVRILKQDEKNASKPDNILVKIVEGRMSKFYEEIVLMEQEYLLDDSKKVSDVLTELVAKVGERVEVRRFARYALGDNGAADA
jgi:elongation factor Ts